MQHSWLECDGLISSHSVLFLEALTATLTSVTICVLRIQFSCPVLLHVFQTSITSAWRFHKHLKPSIFPEKSAVPLLFPTWANKTIILPVAQKMKPGCHPLFLFLPHPPWPPSPVTSTLLIFQISSPQSPPLRPYSIPAISFVQMTTTASELLSLWKNPNPSPSHSPHYNQNDFSKIIVSASLSTSLLCLKLFVTWSPDAPPIALHLVHPHLFSPPSLTQHYTHAKLPVVLQIQSLSKWHSLYLECSLPFFSWLIPNYLSDIRVDTSSSRKTTLDSQDQVLCSQMTLHSGL